MPRTATNIRKRKDGRWEGRYIRCRVDGKAKYASVYAHSYAEARAKLEDAKERLVKETEKRTAGTVSVVGEAWLEEAAVTLKSSSINKYEDILRCYILPEFGNCELSEISNEQLIGFEKRLLKSGGANNQGLSGSTVQVVMSAMNSLRIHALRRDCTVSFTTECVSLKKESTDARVLSVDEEERLIRWLCAHFDLTALAILLCLFSGIRIGEVCALNWNDFNFQEGIFSVTKTMQRVRTKGDPARKTEVQILTPKSDCSERRIPIPDNLMGLLKEHCVPGAFLTTGDKKAFVEPRTLENRFKRILEKAVIPDINFHAATRHTFATRCVEAGVDIKCLSEILGHADVSITLNRYVHTTMSLKSRNMAKLSGRFPLNGIASGE